MRVETAALATFLALIIRFTAVADDATPMPVDGNTAAAPVRQPTVDPTILLLRDDSVRAELKLADTQRRAIDDLLKTHNRVLLAIRDVSPSGADQSLRSELGELRQQLANILNEQQRARLSNISLQVQGYDAILRSDVSTKLGLTEEQQKDLTTAADNFRAAADELRKSSVGTSPEQLQQSLAKLQKDRQQRVLAILNKEQQTQYAVLLGEPFSLGKAKASPADAPEFDGINAWMNSGPITMESLRGRVVIVHFFAFGCINCIHNYPWYKDWQERLPDKGVTIIGIHTPETANEAKDELLKASLESKGLKFPVAVDREKRMWDAWHNRIWPSVYIIDKHGRLRFWWYGELDWQGAGNQKVAEDQIARLLAEE